jgi:hypothetical protein
MLHQRRLLHHRGITGGCSITGGCILTDGVGVGVTEATAWEARTSLPMRAITERRNSFSPFNLQAAGHTRAPNTASPNL